MSARLLLVEDDRVLRTTLADALESEGYEVIVAEDGVVASDTVFSRHFDLVLLDLMLPKRGGLEVLREMREKGLATPVVILTVRGDENDKVLGLELGADDYVTKPFSLRELLARVRAHLRRNDGVMTSSGPAAARGPRRLDVGDVSIDLARHEVVRDGTTQQLSLKEAKILALLASEEGRIVTRERFLREIWGDDAVSERTIDTHVLNLRHKIESDPKQPRHILTVHGVGYRWAL